MLNKKWHVLALSLGAVAAMGGAAPAYADYPDRAVTMVVPYPPGGTTDILARLVSNKLTEKLGQTFVVENRPGAGGQIGTAAVARAKPDGYTIMMGTINTHGINAALMKSLSYKTIEDFAPVSTVADTPNVLIATKDAPFSNLKEMIAYAKANPGAISFGSTSMGGSPHMSGELLKAKAGIDMVHVPYQGGGPMLNDVIGGQIPIGFDNLPSSAAHIASGNVRGLAVTTTERWSSFKDIPTMVESGVEDYEVAAWFGVLAPAATPKPIVEKLSTAIAEALKEEEVAKRLEGLGARPVGDTPEQFTERIKSEVAKWTEVVEINKMERL
ncbi:tripartite tricarboxylate transporter substrate binding protein [Pusillimonas sp. SM2304]|uniref:Bug family tripartite tricarboxylate transporter substrate binding protein n=1 Tax=Pusillimonas sp. SM2304 TaxID=3073241 RepID=UPI002874EC4E|nr:tripartite tricarboxylate transporter substrate binding protein [Pusillimonas sp. SM2304]MDS1139574.1 tripartite tricarboxylate transporter substrate binding protein [Pusillimonas sp. SM2304]